MKNITVVILLLCFAATLSADPSLMLGGGVNVSSIGEVEQTSLYKLGFNTWLGFEQSFIEHFSLITGVSIETRGELEKEMDTLSRDTLLNPTITQITDVHVDMLYLQIPILAQVNILLGIFRLNLFAGPDLGIFLSAKNKNNPTVYLLQLDTIQHLQKDTVDFSKEVNMLDLGINAGLGFEVVFDKWAAFIRPGYYFGLTDFMNKKRAQENGTDPAGKHRNVYIKIGVKFNFENE